MTHLPTSNDVTELAHAIARDGLTSHENALAGLAQVARESSCHAASAAVLADPSQPEILRSRAFLTIARNWHTIRESASRWGAFRRSFDDFLGAWNDHQRRREAGEVDGLWESRSKLDGLRADMTTRRNMMM